MRRRLLSVPLAAAAAVLLVGGAAFAWTAARRQEPPATVVGDYFAALARGDAPAALALGDVPAVPTGYLTSEVLREQQRIAAITDVRVTGVAGSGDVRTVRFGYRLGFAGGAQQVSGSVRLDHHASGWRLEASALPVQLSVREAKRLVTLAGTALPSEQVALFPGALPVEVHASYLELTPEVRALGFGAAATRELAVRVTATGRAALQQAVAAGLRSCFPGTGAHAAIDCPLPSSDQGRVVPGSLVGRLARDPHDAVLFSVSGIDDGRIAVTGTATFSGSYRELDYANVAVARRGTLHLAIEGDAAPTAPARVALQATG